MSLYENIKAPLKQLLEKPAEELTRLQRTARYLIEFSRHCTRELLHDRATQMAAALTYHTLFSLLPTLVLSLVVMKTLVGPEELENYKTQAVDFVIQALKEAAQDQPSPDASDAQPPSPAPPGVNAAENPPAEDDALGREGFVNVASNLSDKLQEWIDKLEKINLGSIGVVGVLLFIWGATGLLRTIENSFNIIYAAPSSRRWYIKLPLYYTVITLGPIVLLAGQYVQNRAIKFVEENDLTGWAAGPMVLVSPMVSTWAVLTLMYVLLPNTRVRVSAAAIGGLIAAIGWVVVIEFFSIYVQRAASATLYGALALVPLFLLWLWVTWLIILFGLEVTYTIQSMKGRRFKNLDKPAARDAFIDPRWVIPMMGLIGQAFEKGKTIDDGDLAERLNLPMHAVSRMGESLRKAGLLNRVETTGSAQTAYGLARPPAQIAVADLIAVGHTLGPDGPASSKIPGRAVIRQISQAEQRAAEDRTLDQIMQAAAG